ncbi:MAG: hypothetical protein A3K03_06180 [Bdellovibrionales bacterium RIFOXYD1_FULL_44_7]|nr:MAG: hypothetical protein A3K03_06180 [Bdellovibrionales bacterium RIFOXYD1_FULL_44_7]
MNAIDLLKADHEIIDKLATQADQADDWSEKSAYIAEIQRELELHTELEESMLYPLFTDNDKTRSMIEHFFDDHQAIRDLMDEISNTEDENEANDKFGELVEAINAHVDDEENIFFPIILRSLNDSELNDLGTKFEAEKEESLKAA